MEGPAYLVRKEGSKLVYSNAMILESGGLKLLEHPIRAKILKALSDEAMYPAQLAERLRMHEQKVYYHIKQMMNAGVLRIAEKKEIRGTTAKKLAPKSLNFAVSLGSDWKDISKLVGQSIDISLERFLKPFIEDSELNADIVVGSPDPHGPFKARARDSHLTIALSLFLGRHCNVPADFAVKLDVDSRLETDKNMIIVGGPVTNMLSSRINGQLPVRFSDERPWGLISESGKKYTEHTQGVVSKIQNPLNKDRSILHIAGIGVEGTRAAIIGIIKNTSELLETYSGQISWSRVVQGYDLDGDGFIDSSEIVE